MDPSDSAGPSTGFTQRFQGFTQRRIAHGKERETPETPIRRSAPSFTLGVATQSPPPESSDSDSPILQPAFVTPHSPPNPFNTDSGAPRITVQTQPPAASAPPPTSAAPAPVAPPAPAAPAVTQPPAQTQAHTQAPPPVQQHIPAQPSVPATAPNSGPDLAAAISLLAQTLSKPAQTAQSTSSERSNVRDPDQFDGSDPTKLRSFFVQLELVFKARPRTFHSDEKKVTYAISYLKGTALQWFEPFLLEASTANPPLFMSDYEVFQEELRTNFGPYDVTGSAEHDLEKLEMSDNQRIAKYITQFNRLATQVGWGHEALRYQFYKGLPDRLKDRISEVGKPKDLYQLRDLAQSLDARYWERKTERSRDPGAHRSSSSGNKSSSSNPSSQKPSASSSNSNQKSGNSGSSPSKPSSSSKSPAKTPKPYSDKLGKDGKLTAEERQRRFANNLCLFCGGSGHSASACPKKTSSAAKGRAAQATDSAPEKPPAPAASKN